jgi:hypothetical protein
MLIAVEWLVYLFVVTAALVAGLTLVLALGVLTPLAVYRRVAHGRWPAWGNKLGAALTIAGATALFLAPGIAYVVTR